jgi:dephospho-CoA kinase
MAQHRGVIALDIPLLLEARLEDLVDEIWVIDASRRLQLRRLSMRDGLSARQSLRRIRAQMSRREKRRRADRVINNSGSLKELRREVITSLHATRVALRSRRFSSNEFASSVPADS